MHSCRKLTDYSMPTKLELPGAGVMAKRDRRSNRKVIDRRLKEGRGQGRGAEYKPYLRVQDVPLYQGYRNPPSRFCRYNTLLFFDGCGEHR